MEDYFLFFQFACFRIISFLKCAFSVLINFVKHCCSNHEGIVEKAMKRRALQRSVMQYSTFDWSSIPLSQERRLVPESVPDTPRILTVRFR